ncbi:MAG: ribosome-associated translation inhibitor RaiA [Ruminococcaceae bacterium]|nr:ribosome-associated translation inhibitor RaiA [Oscillospiraceae bacterium]
MKFTYNARKMDITDPLKLYAEKKLSKLDRFFSADSEAGIVCRTERGRYTAEVTVRSANMLFRAQNTANDMYAAIDEVADMIERQVRKNKTKLEKRLRAGAFEREIPESAAMEEAEEAYDLVRIKRFALKPMDVEEAILQMNLLNHQFYAFRNASDENRFCVVYRRNDGGYGMIENEEQ